MICRGGCGDIPFWCSWKSRPLPVMPVHPFVCQFTRCLCWSSYWVCSQKLHDTRETPSCTLSIDWLIKANVARNGGGYSWEQVEHLVSRWLVLKYSCQPLAGCQLGHWVVAKATCSDQVNRKDMHAAQTTTFPCLETGKINGWNLGQSGWWGIWYPLLHMRWEVAVFPVALGSVSVWISVSWSS